jgi:hypothetical protein
VILPWPLTTSAELAAVLRPGGHLRPDSALRVLREKGLRAQPITFVPRSGRGAQGRVVWYSALMLDVCRLVRTGDEATAMAAHAAADRMASHRAARFVAEWLAERGGPEPDPAALDADTGGALTRLATLTASARAALGPALGVESFAGRVRETTGKMALVVADDGNVVSIPSPRSASEWANTPVVIDFEDLGEDNGTFWVRAAFDPAADLNERVPGGPRLLTDAERERLATSTAAR